MASEPVIVTVSFAARYLLYNQLGQRVDICTPCLFAFIAAMQYGEATQFSLTAALIHAFKSLGAAGRGGMKMEPTLFFFKSTFALYLNICILKLVITHVLLSAASTCCCHRVLSSTVPVIYSQHADKKIKRQRSDYLLSPGVSAMLMTQT